MKTVEDYRMYFSPDEDDFRGWISNHVFAEKNGRILSFEVDDYRPDDAEKWDVEQWEARQGHITARISSSNTRDVWSQCFRLARILARQGMAQIINGAGKVFSVNLPVEISITFS